MSRAGDDGVEAAVDRALAALDLGRKVRLLAGQDYWTLPADPAIGLRSLVMSDGPVGVRGTGWAPELPGVALPSPTALAATWDPSLARLAGRVVGAGARRRGVHMLLAPTVNLHRSPLAGRHFECYSEDPLLSARIGSAYVAGVQEMGVAATVKHFVANDSETDRHSVDVQVSARALRELYLAPLEAIVREARPWAVMASYNRVNGVPMTEHRALLHDILKEEWGFDGVVVSDWSAARSTVGTALGGLDVVMPALGSPWGDALLAAVRAGRVPEQVVADKVRRVLRLAARTGALAGALAGARAGGPPDGAAMRAAAGLEDPAPAEAAAARQLATRSFVLATNDGVLPLRPERLRRIAVIGALAHRPSAQGGGSAQVHCAPVVSPLAALTRALGGSVEVTYAEGADPRAFLPAASGPRWTSPDGAPGVRCTLRARDGRRLHESVLDTATVRWMGGYPGAGEGTGLGTIELAARLTPTAAGAHRFAVSGFRVHTLEVAGRVVWHGPVYRPGADPADIFLGSAEHRVTLPLRAGIPVDVRLTQHVTDERSTAFVAMTLGYAPPARDPDEQIAEAVACAAGADVALVFVGTTEETETEGADRTSLGLPGWQDELVARVASANPATVAVVNAGSPVLLPWASEVAAILLTWFPGQQAGAAVADVLLGVDEPGGRLPVTWPRRQEDCPVLSITPEQGVLRYHEGVLIGYRAWAASGRVPLFPFGHGLGYTTWSYDRLEVTPGPGLGSAGVHVRNTGPRRGREVVQVYLRPRQPCPAWPVPRLAGFVTVEADPGATAVARVDLPERALQVWADGWRRPNGPFLVEAGRSVGDRRTATEVAG